MSADPDKIHISASIYKQDGKARRLLVDQIARTTGTEMEEPDLLRKYGQVMGHVQAISCGQHVHLMGGPLTHHTLYDYLKEMASVRIAKESTGEKSSRSH